MTDKSASTAPKGDVENESIVNEESEKVKAFDEKSLEKILREWAMGVFRFMIASRGRSWRVHSAHFSSDIHVSNRIKKTKPNDKSSPDVSHCMRVNSCLSDSIFENHFRI